MSAPYKSFRDFLELQALPAETPDDEPLVRDYTVGLVVPQCGVNGPQLNEVIRRLREIAAVLPNEGRALKLVVPGYDREEPARGMQMEVLNLTRLSKVQMELIGLEPRAGGTATAIRYYFEHKYMCDEVWCCPEQTHSGRSVARANAVYRLGQEGPRAVHYKIIPPWVQAPPGRDDRKKATAKKTKGWTR